MPFLVIPNEAYSDQANVWVAAINDDLDPAVTVLDYGVGQKALTDGWTDFVSQDGKNRIRYQRVTLENLAPRKWHPLVLRVGGQIKADGSVITLPERLPNAGVRPFTVLLASCFYGHDDKAGAVGQTFLQLPADAKPEIKILC